MEAPARRRCIGSTRFGIEAHHAPIEDLPRQPSQRDAYGRMCRRDWNLYTSGLARDAKARKAAEAPAADEGAAPIETPATPTDEERHDAADVMTTALAATRVRQRKGSRGR